MSKIVSLTRRRKKKQKKEKQNKTTKLWSRRKLFYVAGIKNFNSMNYKS